MVLTLSASLRRELAADWVKSNRARTTSTQTGAMAVLEICTEADSTLGQVISEAADTVCRYTASLDFRTRETLDAALRDVARYPGAHVMASIPCTAGSSWQRINIRRGGAKQRRRIAKLKEDMHLLLSNLRIVAQSVRAGGGTISFEWPRYCSLWREDAVQAFIEEFQLQKVDFDGCSVGLTSTLGEPLLKPWRILSDNRSLLTALIDR